MGFPEATSIEGDATGDTSSAVPSTSVTLTGVPQTYNVLPDLVETDYEPPAATHTLEDLEAASTLLSLSDTLEDTLEEEDDNTLLMPIGGANNPEDIAPQPLHLDQVSVDNLIAGLVETEEMEKDTEDEIKNPTAAVPVPTVQPLPIQTPMDPPPNVQPPDNYDNTKKGSLKTKTYVLKKPEVKRLFKCSECDAVKSSIQKLNEHH